MSREQFQAIFEEVAPQWLQVAYDFINHDERCTTIWICSTSEDGFGVTAAAYAFGDQRIGDDQVVGLVPGVTEDDHDEHVDALGELWWQFAEVDQESMPQRMVIRYDVEGESMDAEFSYEPVVPVDVELSDPEVMKLWVQRLVTTGNDSTDLMIAPGTEALS